MRAQIQIIIALVILLALITATLSYVSTITVVINKSYYGYTLKDWVIINEELDTLELLALHLSSYKAAETFNQTFFSNYVEAYTEYANGDYSYDFTQSLSNFIDSLNKASLAAKYVLGNESIKIINNWISWKQKAGYIVNLVDFKPIYHVEIGMIDNTHITYGLGQAGIIFIIDIVTPMGEERVYNKSIIAEYYMEFDIGHPYGDAIHIPVKIRTTIIQNGIKYYYMVPEQHLELIMISNIFTRLSSLAQYTNGNTTIVKPIATFYYGNGTSYVMFKQEYTNLWEFANDIIDYLVYPDSAYHQRGTFLWASISSITIDNITVYCPLKIVFKYNHTGSYYSWTLYIGVQGDENAPIAY